MEAQTNIKDLYSGNAKIEVKFAEHIAPFSVDLMSSEFSAKTMDFESKPDCKVGSWTANRWFRTDKGASYKKYDSIANLKRGISASARARGLTVEGYSIEAVKETV